MSKRGKLLTTIGIIIALVLLVPIWMGMDLRRPVPTLLIWSAENGKQGLASFLINRGVSVNSTDIDGETPLHMAALRGQDEMVQFLIDRGADVNARDRLFGWTPLHAAAQEGHTEIVRMLIEKGANVNVREEGGELDRESRIKGNKRPGLTPLELAKLRQNTETADLLEQHGAVMPE